MQNEYPGVITRFLRHDERLIQSEEKEMPLVIEATQTKDINFLQKFMSSHTEKILHHISHYGAVLLRGFDVQSDEDFENVISSLQGFQGISEAFMSEHGRIPVGNLKYVLHTNSIYKTGGTFYLGGFHSENYYSPDVPSYIYFCCHKPSTVGGETGLVNMEKVYQSLDDGLKIKLEKNPFLVSEWTISEVKERYRISNEKIETICKQFELPIIGNGLHKFILMYKPSVFHHPITQHKSMQINLFELPTLNNEIRKCFIKDYQGKTWFWHRLVWRLPKFVFSFLENTYVFFASFIHSPKETFKILKSKIKVIRTKNKLPPFYKGKVGSCFNSKNVKDLAKTMRNYYSSCLWQKGDILLVDNRKVAHAGMPGAGPRLVRAIISHPIEMTYNFSQPGKINCKYRTTESVGHHILT